MVNHPTMKKRTFIITFFHEKSAKRLFDSPLKTTDLLIQKAWRELLT